MSFTSRKRGRESVVFDDDDLASDEERDFTDDEEIVCEVDLFDVEDPLYYDVKYPVWSNHTNGKKRIEFDGAEEFLIPLPDDGRPVDFFNILMDENFLESIVAYTNKRAEEEFSSPDFTPLVRFKKWTDLTVHELKTFLGLMLHTGTMKLLRLSDYWRTHWLFGLKCFSAYMGRDRFLMILRFLSFTDTNVHSASEIKEKITTVVDYFNDKMNSIFYPQRELSVDRSMLLCKDRVLFSQNVRGKRKFGVKLYTLSDPQGLILKCLAYRGHHKMGVKLRGDNVVLDLMKEKLCHGHSLFMDEGHSSYPLALKLLENNTYCTGTVRMDRKYLPTVVIAENPTKGETIARYSEGVLIGKWRDEGVVSYISTEYENDIVEIASANGEKRRKPLPIIKYNAMMNGVDREEQMMAFYPAERSALGWNKKLFIHIVHMLLLNAHLLYNKYMAGMCGRAVSLYDFRLSVLEGLLPKQEEPQPELPLLATGHTLTKLGLRSGSNRTKQKDCRVCSKGSKRKQSRFVCEACPGVPGLCPGVCFDSYHKKLTLSC